MYGNGIVGSTTDKLNFISANALEVANEGKHITLLESRRLKFILGTEAGMVTLIVTTVQDILVNTGCNNLEVEIVFPESSQIITVKLVNI